MLITQVLGY